MSGNILSEMLLIQEPSVFKLYKEIMSITGFFIAPVFTIALLIEFLGEMNFGEVVKKLLLIIIFMSTFYQFHQKAVELSLETASYSLKKVSPRNLFVKKWFQVKVRTKQDKQWSFLESFAIPNLNDLLATGFFLMAKVFIWLLKLIYSSVYHLTYVFSGLTAVLYFLGWTKDALKGTVQASIWCMVLPFVIVAILSLVGNSIDETALSGGLIVSKVDTIIWLFGVTLLLLMSPVITYGMIKGEGIHSFGSKMGSVVVGSGLKAAAIAPVMAAMPARFYQVKSKAVGLKENLQTRIRGGKSSELKIGGTERSSHQSTKSQTHEGSKNTETKFEGRNTHDNKIQSSVQNHAPKVTVGGKSQTNVGSNRSETKTVQISATKTDSGKSQAMLPQQSVKERNQNISKAYQSESKRQDRSEKRILTNSTIEKKMPLTKRSQREL